jgi:hypothetical protein
VTSGESLWHKRAVAVISAVICALGLAFNSWFAVHNRTGWGVDFIQFYAVSRLAGTGHLYDWDALRRAEAGTGFEGPTGRLPVELYACRVLRSFPYGVAQIIWLAGSIIALVAFAAMWPGARRAVIMPAVAWSMPLSLGLLFGQDTAFWLMFFAGGLLLLERKRPWIAGIVFSLCICKFHLALGIPVMLVAQRRWKTLTAGAIAVTALIASCFLIEGPEWPLQYLKLSQTEAFSPVLGVIPNIYALAARLPWSTAIEIAGAVAIVVLLWTACRSGADLGMAGAAAAACGLLISHHALAADVALLIPLSVLVTQRQCVPPWMKAWAFLMITPSPILLLVRGGNLAWQILTVAFVVTAVIVERRYTLSRSARLRTSGLT